MRKHRGRTMENTQVLGPLKGCAWDQSWPWGLRGWASGGQWADKWRTGTDWRSSFTVFWSASEKGTWGPFDTGTGKCDFFLNQSRKMFRELELDLPNLSEAWQSLLEKWTAVGWGWTAVRETCLGSLLGHHMKAGTLRGTPAGFTLEQAEGTKLV